MLNIRVLPSGHAFQRGTTSLVKDMFYDEHEPDAARRSDFWFVAYCDVIRHIVDGLLIEDGFQPLMKEFEFESGSLPFDIREITGSIPKKASAERFVGNPTSIWGTLTNLDKFFKSTDTRATATRSENGVEHTNVVGGAILAQLPTLYPSENVLASYFGVNYMASSGYVASEVVFTGDSVSIPEVDTPFDGRLRQVGQSLGDTLVYTVNSAGRESSCEITDLRVLAHDGFVAIYYTLYVHWNQSNLGSGAITHYKIECSHRWTYQFGGLEPSTEGAHPSRNSYLQEYDMFVQEILLDWSSVPSEYQYLRDFVKHYLGVHSTHSFRPVLFLSDLGGSGSKIVESISHMARNFNDRNLSMDHTAYDSLFPGYLQKFTRAIQGDAANLDPAIYYSTIDAYTGFAKVLKSENIQTLYKLPALAGIFGNIEPIVKIFENLAARKYLEAGLSMVDALSTAKLLHDYTISPNVKLISEFAREYDQIVERLGKEVMGARTLYGKFSYTLPGDPYGFGPTRLIARSKIRVNFSHSNLLTICLGGYALGLMPRLTAFWDIIPFSFVVNWFAGIGKRLDDIDTNVFMLLVDHLYGVHSVKVWSPLNGSKPQDLYDDPSWTTHSDTKGYVYYRRTVLDYLPYPRESKYDFRAGQGVPDMSNAGALLWSLIR